MRVVVVMIVNHKSFVYSEYTIGFQDLEWLRVDAFQIGSMQRVFTW